MTEVAQTEFEQTVDNWSRALADEIDNSLESGKQVMLIALSRKMPRFIDWLILNATTPQTKRIKALLSKDEVHLSTEYCIPVIFGGHQEEKSSTLAGIIIDDAVIFGATANRTALEWEAFTGEMPRFTSLYRSDVGKLIKDLESFHTYSMTPIALPKLEGPFMEISSRIMKSSLPVDMEYPILHIQAPYSKVKEHISDNSKNTHKFPTAVVISSSDSDSKESFTVIFDDEDSKGQTYDFAKARLFDKDNRCCMEILAPDVISCRSLKDRHMFAGFPDSSYQDAWESVYDVVFHPEDSDNDVNIFSSPLKSMVRREAKLRTLNIWANYLKSLSMFVRHRQLLMPQDSVFSLKKNDVALILGPDMSEEMMPKLIKIINSNDTCSSQEEDAVLPVFVNSPESKDEYLQLIAKSLKPDLQLEDNLDNLFSTSHFSSPMFENRNSSDIFGHHVFGETFESMEMHVKRFHYNDSDILIRLHAWIDRRIDESRIAPKFLLVKGSDGENHFRRFFLSGSNKQPKH